ncbi:hypothetical protein NOR_08296 [Metarhizium rileyi]|uniref:Sulfotransferase family protein n=1 Tax=Metarhizium rileyi (strain RCEF 4871) TaxID=1649241 RepID=A0A166WJ04_METRR|nr:hypothetical protein NOR_08296 [Metarhizium rileyi RCEF 4871]
MSPATTNREPLRYYLISYPRTASSLFLKILALDAQPGFSTGEYEGGYFFMPAYNDLYEPSLRATCVNDWTPDQRGRIQDSLQRCFDKQQQWVESAQAKGLSVFVKEHATFLAEPTERSRLLFGSKTVNEPKWTVKYDGGATHSKLNITMLPDEYLLTWLPTFLIRHPALAFPSLYRTLLKREDSEKVSADNFAALVATVKWTRDLYDFYVQRRGHLPCSPGQRDEWPIVLDADDVIAHPRTVSVYCEKLGMDPRQLRYTWDQVGPEHMSRMRVEQVIMRSTLYASTGVMQNKTSDGLDIADEVNKWKTEFGVPAAEHIEMLVRGAMPDYEYLRAKRLRVDSDAA